MITVTITDKRHIAGATAACIAAGGISPQEYAQARFEDVCASWAETTGVDRISVAEFVMRFPGAAMDAAKASNDPTVTAILAQLRAVQTVRLGHPTTTNGVGYLVSVGLLTQAQADVVLFYEVPAVA